MANPHRQSEVARRAHNLTVARRGHRVSDSRPRCPGMGAWCAGWLRTAGGWALLTRSRLGWRVCFGHFVELLQMLQLAEDDHVEHPVEFVEVVPTVDEVDEQVS